MIDYNLLNQAAQYYESLGYKRVEVPWLVPSEIDSITRPNNMKEFSIVGRDKNLIASGEQGFLFNEINGFLPKGRFYTITPCFRDEVCDLTHLEHFMKLELYSNIPPENESNMLNHAYGFFENTLRSLDFRPSTLTTKAIDDTFDIIGVNGFEEVELGSYGKRQYKHLEWWYGTGIAEPRFSNFIKELTNENRA